MWKSTLRNLAKWSNLTETNPPITSKCGGAFTICLVSLVQISGGNKSKSHGGNESNLMIPIWRPAPIFFGAYNQRLFGTSL